MSRYIEIAHSLFGEGLPLPSQAMARRQAAEPQIEDAFALPVEETQSRRVRATGSIATRAAAGRRLPYYDREFRLSNLGESVARHERALAVARGSVLAGSASRGMILQLTRRVHEAREELARFNREGSKRRAGMAALA